MRRVAASVALVAAASRAATVPNVLTLLVDDSGWGDWQVNGLPSPGPALTPHVLEMSRASSTVVFSRFYIGGSVCSPTRSSVLTGRTPSRECIINVEQNALPALLNSSTTASAMRAVGGVSAFFGKWHLGSLTNATSPNCYPNTASNGTCTTGYIVEKGGLCCDGRDAHVAVAPPTLFGFDSARATSQVSPSATANCGCWATTPGGGVDCELGHYAGPGGHNGAQPWLECDAYLATQDQQEQPAELAVGAEGPAPAAMTSVRAVTPVDDAAYLVDGLERFVRSAVAAGKPWHAQVSFHQTHIPYIAPPAFRALYPNATANEADYWGATSAVDAQVGRIRALLRELAIETNTLVSLHADNGPELSTGGHDATAFPNPGSTGGLLGRKRALTEGGIRVVGLVEYPALVTANRVETEYATSSMDLLPTLRELVGAPPEPLGLVVDGESLVPYLRGATANRSKPIGHLSDFAWITGAPECGNGTGVACLACSDRARQAPPSYVPATFTPPFGQLQVAWTEGRLKLFGCHASPNDWRFGLFDVVADRGEAADLWPALGATVGDAMFTRMLAWHASVRASVANETGCTVGARTL